MKDWLKLEIKVKTCDPNIRLDIIKQGDWIDLKVPNDITLFKDRSKNFCIISLGVAMELPKGFEAIVVPRSSTYKHFGILLTNSFGVIDNSYSGNNDYWGFPVLAFRDVTIPAYTRIAQFRIQPSQHSSIITKLRWLFSRGVRITYVSSLDTINRGGFGSTGK